MLIFLFFMITDPKTSPAGRVGRVIFGFLVAVASVLLMAPQTNEFGTKVGLLAGLVVVCAARPVLDRFLPEPKSAADRIGVFARRVAVGRGPHPGVGRVAARVGLVVAAVFILGAGIVVAGTPARGTVAADTSRAAWRACPTTSIRGRFPAITVDVEAWDGSTAAPDRPGHPRDPRREPRAREPGAPATRPDASSPPSTTATG